MKANTPICILHKYETAQQSNHVKMINPSALNVDHIQSAVFC